MRRVNKFKNFTSSSSLTRKLPNKLDKFYKSKWVKTKTNIRKFSYSNLTYNNPLIKKISNKFISKLNQYYKLNLEIKTNILSLFDNSYYLANYKNLKEKNSLVKICLVKPLYQIDIMLWYLNFFSSTYNAKQSVAKGSILVNNLRVKSNFKLKKGDIISFQNSDFKYFDIKKNNNIYLNNIIFLTFIEVDFYNKTIVITKNLEEITLNDYKLLIDQYIDIFKLL